MKSHPWRQCSKISNISVMVALIPKGSHTDEETDIDENSNPAMKHDLEDDLANVLGLKVKDEGYNKSKCWCTLCNIDQRFLEFQAWIRTVLSWLLWFFFFIWSLHFVYFKLKHCLPITRWVCYWVHSLGWHSTWLYIHGTKEYTMKLRTYNQLVNHIATTFDMGSWNPWSTFPLFQMRFSQDVVFHNNNNVR